jgi:hypothetical protein
MTPAVRDLILKGGPTLDLNMLSGVLDPRITFARASSGTYFDATGMLQIASANEPRFSYDPSTFAPRGLLVEPSRPNAVLHGSDLTDAAWVKTATTAAKDQIGINGQAASASSLTATAGNGTCLQAITLASSARFQTAFVKRLTGSGTVEMTMDNGTTWTAVTVTSSWSRVSIPTQTLANPTVGFRLVTNTDSIAVDFVQNEAGTFATSVIPTTSAAATRAADQVSMLTGDWFSPIAGTFLYEYDTPTNTTGVLGGLADLTFNNTIYPSASGVANVRVGGVGNTFLTSTPVTGGALNKQAISFGSTGVLGSTNGSAVGVGVPGSPPYPWTSRLSIGCSPWNLDSAPGGHVRRVRYWPRALVAAQLRAITQ